MSFSALRRPSATPKPKASVAKRPLVRIFLSFLLLFSATAQSAVVPTTPPAATGVVAGPDAATLLTPLLHVSNNSEPLYFILVDKDAQRLLVLEHNGSSLREVRQFVCATGENHGPKRASGDSRTPEGVYFITEVFTDSKVTIFGKRAYHLDYPNVYDAEHGHDGNGIYIHGTNRTLLPFSTNGCITLRNNDLDQLAPYLRIATIPVIIVPSLRTLTGLSSPALKNGDFQRVSSTILPDSFNRSASEYRNLFIMHMGNQVVAQGEFLDQPSEFKQQLGLSRLYLKMDSGSGLTTKSKMVHTAPIRLLPENPVKIATRNFRFDTPPEVVVSTVPGFPANGQLGLDTSPEQASLADLALVETTPEGNSAAPIQLAMTETAPTESAAPFKPEPVEPQPTAEVTPVQTVSTPAPPAAVPSIPAPPENTVLAEAPAPAPEPLPAPVVAATVVEPVAVSEPAAAQPAPAEPAPAAVSTPPATIAASATPAQPPATEAPVVKVDAPAAAVAAPPVAQVEPAQPEVHTEAATVSDRAILDLLEKWRAAWERKDIDSYISCYHPEFRQGEKDRSAWRTYKDRLNRQYRFITVAVTDISIRHGGGQVFVTFHQLYKSDRFKADGTKTLVLARNGNDWQITQELWHQ